MTKAVFIDFYGTIVHEDGEVIRKVRQKIFDTGEAQEISEISTYWWNEFQTSFMSAYGSNFQAQRKLEYQSLSKTIQHFHSSADARQLSDLMFEHWGKPPIFEESQQFFALCPLPFYIVSNIDRDDILKAISHHSLNPTGVFTSEDARSYKPRRELFELALKSTGFCAEQVVHIGDSLSSDVNGASAVGINTIWVNRSGREVPVGICAVSNLLEVYDTEFF